MQERFRSTRPIPWTVFPIHLLVLDNTERTRQRTFVVCDRSQSGRYVRRVHARTFDIARTFESFDYLFPTNLLEMGVGGYAVAWGTGGMALW